MGGRSRIWTIDDFLIGRKLGCGKFGRVYCAIEKRTQTIVALKVMSKKYILSHNMEKYIRRELSIHLRLNHPNIIKLYTYFWDSKRIYLVLEYAECDLFSLYQRKDFSEQMAAKCTYEVVQGLQYLHKNNIYHRDLKPENVLMINGVAKISDMGWAVHSARQNRKTLCGTLDYLCPEMVNGIQYNASADIWTVGIFLYDLLHKNSPFHGQNKNQTYNLIKKGQIAFKKGCSSDYINLVKQLLQQKPSMRPTIEEILRNQFFRRLLNV